jgi:hypothetical protein
MPKQVHIQLVQQDEFLLGGRARVRRDVVSHPMQVTLATALGSVQTLNFWVGSHTHLKLVLKLLGHEDTVGGCGLLRQSNFALIGVLTAVIGFLTAIFLKKLHIIDCLMVELRRFVQTLAVLQLRIAHMYPPAQGYRNGRVIGKHRHDLFLIHFGFCLHGVNRGTSLLPPTEDAKVVEDAGGKE